MALIKIEIEDAGEEEGRPAVHARMESDPPFPLINGQVDTDKITSAQGAAYVALLEVVGSAGVAQLIVVDAGQH